MRHTHAKKFLALLLAVCLLVGALPMAASAATVTERESNDTMGTAQSITANQFVKGNLSSSSDVDYYKVVLNSAGYISLTFNHEYVDNSRTYWYATLYNGDNKELASYGFAGNNIKSECNPIGVPSGTYYVKVNDDYHSSVSYELMLSYTQSSSWEKEFNDTFSTGNTISSNSSVKGSLMTSSDVDYYKVSLSSAGCISLTFNHEYVDNSRTYWYATLYNGDNKELASYGFTGNNIKSECSPIGVPSGTYYVKVNDDYHSSVSYELKLNYTKSNSWEQEFNNTFNTANAISMNSTVNGSLMTNSDVDYYRVLLNSSKSVQLVFNHDYIDSSRAYWYATIYNEDFKEISKYSFAGKDTETISDSIGLASGVYYVKVQDDYHSDVKYSFNLSNGGSTTNPDPDDPTPDKVAVTGVSLNKTSLELKEGETAYLTATVKPADADNKAVTWSSSNTSVATVTSGGTVKAVSEGTATITVKTSDGGYTARCTVKVTADDGETPRVTSFSVNGVSGKIDGNSKKITVTLLEEAEYYTFRATTSPSDAKAQLVLDGMISFDLNAAYPLSRKPPFYFTLEVGDTTKTEYQVEVKASSSGNDTVFEDVSSNSWYYECVQWAVANGITSGTGKGKFSPGAFCTRAQAVTFLWRAAGKPASSGSGTPFRDVKSSDYYYQAMLWAVEKGVVAGTDKTHFSPNQSCTRAQIVTFLWRNAGKPAEGSSSFIDVPRGSYYATAASWAKVQGIASGYNNNDFRPNNRCTRAEIVTLLYQSTH